MTHGRNAARTAVLRRDCGPVLDHRVPLGHAFDLGLTLGPTRRGRHDPCTRVGRREVWRATRTPEGEVTLCLRHDGDAVVGRAWGPGSRWALEQMPRLIGLHDDPAAFAPSDPLLRELHRCHPGLRLCATEGVVEALVASVIEQRVTSIEAHRSYSRLVRRYGNPAPGPGGAAGMFVPPAPERLARLPYWAYHPLGIERGRADTIRRVCSRAAALNRTAHLDAHAMQRALRSMPGVGVWTAAEVATVAIGDPDAVSVGDYHLPHQVAWALAGEPRGDDERMLELLEPYRGQRGRALRLITLGGLGPARRAPRARLRAIEHM
jgi:3-methyladenine DNA glycosylase/8-oxoguanine DNA glycosylase